MKYDYQAFFAAWKDWSEFDECEPRFNEANGVYAFRLKMPFGRLHGSSQVLYIGMCDQNAEVNRRPGLWHRLRNYKQRNNGASERLKDLQNMVGDKQVEYSYVSCASPREIEKGLLADYYRHLATERAASWLSKHFTYWWLEQNGHERVLIDSDRL